MSRFASIAHHLPKLAALAAAASLAWPLNLWLETRKTQERAHQWAQQQTEHQAQQGQPVAIGATFRLTFEGQTVEAAVQGLSGEADGIIASSTDPETGILTTVSLLPDGTRVVSKLETRQQPDGSLLVLASDDRGRRAESIVREDGSSISQITEPDGQKTIITGTPEGAVAVLATTPGGGAVETTRDPGGRVVSTSLDPFGNYSGTEIRFSDGTSLHEDLEGNITAYSSQGENLLQATVSRNGNVSSVLTDADGEVLARKDVLEAAREPGQEYYEKVLSGTSWPRLSASSKAHYAERERDARFSNERLERLKQQEETVRQEDENIRQSVEQRRRKAEQAAAAQATEQRGNEEREKAAMKRKDDIDAAYKSAADLRAAHKAAVERGDMTEARRIEREQDRLSEANMKLLEFTPEEQAAMEGKQAVRDRIMNEIIASARSEAQASTDQDWEQDLKESVTAGTRYVSIGSGMQQATKESTRLANFQTAFSEFKEQRLLKRLEDPKTTDQERDVILDMLELSEAQKSAAQEQLRSNARLTAIGYTVDGAMLVGTAGIGIAGAKLGYGTTAKAMAASTRASAATRSASTINRALQGTKRVLTKDLLGGAQLESKLLQSMAENAAVGGAVDAGAQVWRTGTIDPAEVVRSALAGGIMGGAVSSVMSKVIPKVKASAGKPASPQAPGKAPAPATSANTDTEAGLTGGLFDRPEFKNLPTKPSAESIGLEPFMTPAEKAVATVRKPIAKPVPAPSVVSGPRPNILDNPNIKSLPSKPVADLPDLNAWRTPAERVAYERLIHDETAELPAAKAKTVPSGKPLSIFDEPTVLLHDHQEIVGGQRGSKDSTVVLTPEQKAQVGKRYDEPTVLQAEGNYNNPPVAKPKIVYPPKPTNKPQPPKSKAERESSPGQTTATNGSRRKPDDARAQYRRRVPPQNHGTFDRSMDIADVLMKTDPRFANADYEAIARQAYLRAGSGMPPEEVAVLALNSLGHWGIHITPEVLAKVTGLSLRDASEIVTRTWKLLGVKPSATPDSDVPVVEEFNPNHGSIPTPKRPGPKKGGEYKDEALEMDEAKRLEDIAERVPIFKGAALEFHRVRADSKGRLVHMSGLLVDAPQPGLPALYVMDIHGNFYVSPQVGKVKHSSLAGGEKPAAAGRINVEDGVVKMMNEDTGHFKSQPRRRVFIARNEFRRQNVDVSQAVLYPREK